MTSILCKSRSVVGFHRSFFCVQCQIRSVFKKLLSQLPDLRVPCSYNWRVQHFSILAYLYITISNHLASDIFSGIITSNIHTFIIYIRRFRAKRRLAKEPFVPIVPVASSLSCFSRGTQTSRLRAVREELLASTPSLFNFLR